ncbi:MAG: phosphopantothenoylcysteine decarboxylase [Spirochaetales bacterium]|nr:phosphopantothenoylcysteine decarboxylase [Leptospiraceae bacterium]MCP5483166.1 phosphopantothenoylcysteine decarboxylase [Spirochaetales bacterium]MCP5484606.1 phosphopantothenoylcysteine decarboxylase [Spirochaetales bacterium]
MDRPFRFVVVTGPTREWIDPVRFISNPSTGKTGHCLASEALKRGFHEVIYIAGPVPERYQQVEGAQNIAVETTLEMGAAVRQQLADRTILVMAAAPADYTPAQISASKIKKSDKEGLSLQLKPTLDILKSIVEPARQLQGLFRVGFAAETDNLEEYAMRKLREKDLDMICANRVFKGETGFGENENALLIVDREGLQQWLGPGPKESLARLLLDRIELAVMAPAGGQRPKNK